MEDDPYRSLAGELRAMGGFAKDSTPFSEFLWADFLRPRIKAKAIKADFEAALTQALALAKTAKPTTCPAGADRTATCSARPARRRRKRARAKPRAPLRLQATG